MGFYTPENSHLSWSSFRGAGHDNTRPEGQYSIYGGEFEYQIVIDKVKGTHLVILHVWHLSPTLAERRREGGYVPNYDLRFGLPTELLKSKQNVLHLCEEFEKHQDELRAKELADREQELFRVWDKVLRAKEDLERGKEQPLGYTGVEVHGNRAVFTLAVAADEDVVGQPRQVRSRDAVYLAGDVDEVAGKSDTVSSGSVCGC